MKRKLAIIEEIKEPKTHPKVAQSPQSRLKSGMKHDSSLSVALREFERELSSEESIGREHEEKVHSLGVGRQLTANKTLAAKQSSSFIFRRKSLQIKEAQLMEFKKSKKTTFDEYQNELNHIQRKIMGSPQPLAQSGEIQEGRRWGRKKTSIHNQRSLDEQMQVNQRVSQIINSVSYDTLLSIKRAIDNRENVSGGAESSPNVTARQASNRTPSEIILPPDRQSLPKRGQTFIQKQPRDRKLQLSSSLTSGTLSLQGQGQQSQRSYLMPKTNPRVHRSVTQLHKSSSSVTKRSRASVANQNTGQQRQAVNRIADLAISLMRKRQINGLRFQDKKVCTAEKQFAVKNLRQRAQGELEFNQLKWSLENHVVGVDDKDAFIEEGKMAPSTWIKDERQLRRDSHQNNDFKAVSAAYTRDPLARLTKVAQTSEMTATDVPQKFPICKKTLEFGALSQKRLKGLGDLERKNSIFSLKELGREDSESSLRSESLNSATGAPDKGGELEATDSMDFSEDQASNFESERQSTLTEDLISARLSEHEDLITKSKIYDQIIEERKEKNTKTILRFVEDDANSVGFYLPKKRLCHSLCKSGRRARDKQKIRQPRKLSEMTPSERRERLNYLRFRMRIIASANLFIYVLRKSYYRSLDRKMKRQHNKVMIEDANERQQDHSIGIDITHVVKALWHSLVSLWLWFSLISSPFITLYPSISENRTLYYYLWCNEFVFLLDMLRKFFDKPAKSRASDTYEVAINYLKSTFILDLIALFPQVASGLDPQFVWLKILRIYQVWLLHYPLKVLTSLCYRKRDKRQIYVVVYACSTVSRIMILLHYLAIVWLYIGSAEFRYYEPGYPSWQFANSDFAGYSTYKLYIFSVYWVCTVITTVGYGDYAGGTSLELIYTICLEFLGLVVFSVLQVAVLQVVNSDASFSNYITEIDQRITIWLKDLERANFPTKIPNELFEIIQHDLWRSFRRDINLIIEEFDFYQQLSPKLQDYLITTVFGDLIEDFSELFMGCEQQFINNLVVKLKYKYLNHGMVIQSPKSESTKVYFIMRGGVAVCEPTCFGEPILIYGKGAVINLYQTIMQQKLEFKFMAVSPSSIEATMYEDPKTGEVYLSYLEAQMENLFLNTHSMSHKKPSEALGGRQDCIELFSVEQDDINELFELFPNSANKLQEFCVAQLQHLSMTRQKREHFHSGNTKVHFYRKNQLLLENRANIDSDMKVDVQQLNEEQIKSEIERRITLISETVQNIEMDVFQRIEQQIWKIMSQKKRRQKEVYGDYGKPRANLLRLNSRESSLNSDFTESDSFITDSSERSESLESASDKEVEEAIDEACQMCNSHKGSQIGIKSSSSSLMVPAPQKRHGGSFPRLKSPSKRDTSTPSNQEPQADAVPTNAVEGGQQEVKGPSFDSNSLQNVAPTVSQVKHETNASENEADSQSNSHASSFAQFYSPNSHRDFKKKQQQSSPVEKMVMIVPVITTGPILSPKRKPSPDEVNIFNDSYRQSEKQKRSDAQRQNLRKASSNSNRLTAVAGQAQGQGSTPCFHQDGVTFTSILTASFASDRASSPHQAEQTHSQLNSLRIHSQREYSQSQSAGRDEGEGVGDRAQSPNLQDSPR